MTATGVAHKVSFSPAQVDFGSGLLVLREQCNDMGVCVLRTEKVGLPIEKQLTVKNEGTVAVTLTLSTAVPYSIVSVLPTLSPGQSGQVTVRFDPSESGNFTGNVQVGITDGQGSVSSSPLVGVAHKIEIDPAELNLGIVFIGIMREEKLTVKNQGVTTVTLEASSPSNASPFTVILPENPSVLDPSESVEATVQFTATTSGEFSHAVRLIINNSFTLEVPLAARAVTFEEFLRMFGTLFVPGTPNLFFDGFEGLSVSLADFQRLAQELLIRQPQSPTPEDLEIAQALEELKAWLDDPAFEQKIQELIQQYPAFGTFVNQIQNEISNLGLTSELTYVQVLDSLVRSLSQLDLLLLSPSDPIFVLDQDVNIAITILTTILSWRAQLDPRFKDLVTKIQVGGNTVLEFPLPIFFPMAVNLIKNDLAKHCGTDECLYNLARRLASVAFILDPDAFYNHFKGLYMEISMAAQAVMNGWWLLGFSERYDNVTEIDIIARKSIQGIGVVIAFIEVKSEKNLSAKDIQRKLSLYADYIENVGKDLYWGNFHVAVLISYEPTSATTVENALYNYNKTTPALVIYCVANCNGFGVGIFAAQFKNMSPGQAAAIAIALGIAILPSSNSVPTENDDPNSNQLYLIGDPILVMLLLMAWTMR